eukprot:TRINITY_DN1394_c0_g1_i4.p1 TRINITY_DN1394_c0_g1~~TRINITY_DN1394_c0_g1_i4.p1  ORF type:complete len:208 (+),score=51.01 TRINITY_DN1394_c0_g1_i4:65-688(+)
MCIRDRYQRRVHGESNFNQVMAQYLDQISNTLNLQEFERIQPLKNLADKAGVKVPHLILGASSLLIVLVLFNYGSSLLSSIIGFLYPAYMSFKTIETSRNSEDSRHWLTYWLVYSFVIAFDPVIAIFFSWLGFVYTFLKIGLFIYLFHPKTRGAALVYDKFLRDLLKKYEEHIDKGISGIGSSIGKTVDAAKPLAAKAAINAAMSNK